MCFWLNTFILSLFCIPVSAWSAIKYIDNPKQQPEDPTPYVIVTVLVDQISFTDFVAKVINL